MNHPLIGTNPPFPILEMDLVHKTGSALQNMNSYPLSQIVVRWGASVFMARYTVGANHGILEARYQSDKSLSVEFSGGTVESTFTADPIRVSEGSAAVYMSSDTAYQQIDQGMEIHGAIPVGTGMPSVLRIPIPGSNGLAVELKPRGFVPKGGSTSTLFFQSIDGKRHLRLDYGYNIKSKTVDFHWNQKGTADLFKITDHTTVGAGGKALYKGAKYFRYGGRVLLVVGLVMDVASIVAARDKWKQTAMVGCGWAGAWAGAEGGGMAGAAVGFWAGTEVPVIGNAVGAAIGGFIGGIGGGIGGYIAGSKLAEYAYEIGDPDPPEASSPVEDVTETIGAAAGDGR